MQNLGRQIVSLFQCNHLSKIIIPPPPLSNSVFELLSWLFFRVALLVGHVSVQICSLLPPVRLGPPCRRPHFDRNKIPRISGTGHYIGISSTTQSPATH